MSVPTLWRNFAQTNEITFLLYNVQKVSQNVDRATQNLFLLR